MLLPTEANLICGRGLCCRGRRRRRRRCCCCSALAALARALCRRRSRSVRCIYSARTVGARLALPCLALTVARHLDHRHLHGRTRTHTRESGRSRRRLRGCKAALLGPSRRRSSANSPGGRRVRACGRPEPQVASSLAAGATSLSLRRRRCHLRDDRSRGDGRHSGIPRTVSSGRLPPATLPRGGGRGGGRGRGRGRPLLLVERYRSHLCRLHHRRRRDGRRSRQRRCPTGPGLPVGRRHGFLGLLLRQCRGAPVRAIRPVELPLLDGREA